MKKVVGVKFHNRFDIEVKDVKTGEIVQRAQAENIVLDQCYTKMCSTSNTFLFNYIHFGSGSGTLSAVRTALFTPIGSKSGTTEEVIYSQPPTPSSRKIKTVLLTEEYVGYTLTEVGTGHGTSLATHAMLEDSEGNPISIGPKTDTQEITIYATIYMEVTLSDGMTLIGFPSSNKFLRCYLGVESLNPMNNPSTDYVRMYVSSDKTSSSPTGNYSSGYIAYKSTSFDDNSDASKYIKTPRQRFATSEDNGKIWSIAWYNTYGGTNGLFRILLPTDDFEGFNFVGKTIGSGDGSTLAFNLPWADINTSKTYKIYLDGVEKTEGIDYSISNSEVTTTVTFTTAPGSGVLITGDWWVDYIPKDSDHILDITLKIQFGSV